ncbi:MAG: nucleotidyltransferase family protein [Inquilinus sp.]|nr:nucleotidyltransferase family protein [Inquilinus sp.]
MATIADVGRLILEDPERRRVLAAVARLRLPDCWIGAGVVRNPVWDRLHGYARPTPLADIDVLYFDPADRSRTAERQLEARLRRSLPGRLWSVRNQARMHRRNGDAPYRSTTDALRFWAETPTAIGVALVGHRLRLIAPFGIADLLGLTVRPTPRFRHKLAVYRRRLASKDWPALWPRLRVLEQPPGYSVAPSRIDLRPRKAGVGWVTT